ncbi:hypothetical protein VB715_15850 [Crocosphaera sp. UHCC 0190]|uniref:hypothetical protein n=1 Tax=Crocosphaera sp. UHCC 0190 TaxID=3110246 RepID=UPI002B200E0B|nr:hypothetical protein [Crocosphaera sp. UHCC 0190]MEA5511247.1 hypothetical protein [Crocosphaera sp. UHCC 0190]
MTDSPTTAQKIAFRRKTIRTMKDELDQTLSSVQSRNYQAAKTPFESAKKKWFTFGGTIKRIAPDLYEIIDPGFKTVNTLLNQASPQQGNLTAQLQRVVEAATKAVTISDATE